MPLPSQVVQAGSQLSCLPQKGLPAAGPVGLLGCPLSEAPAFVGGVITIILQLLVNVCDCHKDRDFFCPRW